MRLDIRITAGLWLLLFAVTGEALTAEPAVQKPLLRARDDVAAQETSFEQLHKVRTAYRVMLAGQAPDKGGAAGRARAAEEIIRIVPREHGALLHDLARDWYHHRTPESKKAFTEVFALAWEQGYKPGGQRVGWYHGRNYLKAMGLMVEDLDADNRTKCADFLFFNGDMDKYLNWPDDHKGGINTDYIHCDWYGAFGGVFYKGDDAEAIRNCRRLKRWLEIAFSPSPGTDDFIKVDGTSFHHWRHYNGYMYAFSTLAAHLYLLHGTDFQVNAKAYLHFRNGVYAFMLMCNSYQHAMSLAGRFPFGRSKLLVSDHAAKKLAILGGPILGTGDADPSMARAYNRLWPGDEDLAKYGAEPVPEGFWQFNYSPAGIYRQDNWVATLKAPTDVFWSSEIYPGANRYGRYQGYGTVEIIYPGGAANSGFKEKGWNWNMPCGGTTIVLPWDELEAKLSRIDEHSSRDFSGALSFQLRPDGLNGIEGECGLYGVDFKQERAAWGRKLSPNHTPSLEFKKSMVCFDGVIICLGSGIANTVKDHPTVTALFQGCLRNPNEPIMVDSTEVTSFPLTKVLPGSASHTLIDACGTGYYTAEGSDVHITRSTQTSPSKTGDGTMTKGDFAAAWLDHGKAPADAGYEYVVVPGTTEERLSEIAGKIREKKLYTVLRKDNIAHVLNYLPKNRIGYVVFAPATGLPGLVTGASDKCLVVAQPSERGLRLSLANPVLGVKRRKSDPSVPKTITIMVRGIWRGSTHPAAKIGKAGVAGTQLAVKTVDGLPIETVLTP